MPRFIFEDEATGKLSFRFSHAGKPEGEGQSFRIIFQRPHSMPIPPAFPDLVSKGHRLHRKCRKMTQSRNKVWSAAISFDTSPICPNNSLLIFKYSFSCRKSNCLKCIFILLRTRPTLKLCALAQGQTPLSSVSKNSSLIF